MSYSERDGQVILTMSREDYDFLMHAIRQGVKLFLGSPRMIATIDRLNSGNPNYRPYRVEEKKP